MRKTFAFLLLAGTAVGVVGFGTADAEACGSGFEEVVVAGAVQCAHPDETPVNGMRPTSFYTAEAEARALTCVGSGTDGNRLQAVFVTEEQATLDSADRAAITQGMINVQAVYRSSSQVVPGVEVIPRWVHTPDCDPSIEVVQVAPGMLADFAATIEALGDRGHDRPDRKYIMWADSSVYCGIATVSVDESKVDNRNDGDHPGYARIDRNCWGYQGSVVAHEVTHTLGAIQPSAPNATPYGHCTDEYDIMCYVDGPDTTTSIDCADHRGELALDCNNDDYFHPDPSPDNWLYRHWNVADSSFVERLVTSDQGQDADDGQDTEVVSARFVDIDRENPHGRAISWLAERGVTRGCDTARFCPDQPVTRGQMAAFLHRFVPDPITGANAVGFADVGPDHPFASDIVWLVETGLTRGCDESSFCPDGPVTRGQMAGFLYRVFAADADVGESGFGDVEGESPFATEIAWVAATGISQGCVADRFCPDEHVTRGQMASFIQRSWERFLDG